MQGLDPKTSYMNKENEFIINECENQIIYQREIVSDKKNEDPIVKISSYDYNNFYFNRCLGKFII